MEESAKEKYLYLVMKGEVEICHNGRCIKKIKEGEVFGEVEFFRGCEYFAEAISAGFTTLVRLQRSLFIKRLKDYRYYDIQQYEKFIYLQDKLLFDENWNSLNLTCFVCESKTHLAQNCDKIHF
jgi:CRP-like cAMP-binding protein